MIFVGLHTKEQGLVSKIIEALPTLIKGIVTQYTTLGLKQEICDDALKVIPRSGYIKVARSLHEFTKKEDLEQNITENLINRFKKKEQTAEVEFNKYYLTRDYGTGYSTKFNRIHRNQLSARYYDAPYSFVLCYRGDRYPLASTSFDAAEDAIVVKQIQGVQGQKERLVPLKWERLLLTLVCEWAEENNICEVQTLPHTESRWGHVREYSKMIYDVTAKRCGFKFDKEKGRFAKQF